MSMTIPTWDLSDRLRKARTLTGLSQVEFAAEVGISRRSVSNYENGETQPNRAVLAQWALRCSVPLAWLEHGVIDLDPDTPDGLGSSHSGCYADVLPFPVGPSDQQAHAA